jgi:hypothetical protein
MFAFEGEKVAMEEVWEHRSESSFHGIFFVRLLLLLLLRLGAAR